MTQPLTTRLRGLVRKWRRQAGHYIGYGCSERCANELEAVLKGKKRHRTGCKSRG